MRIYCKLTGREAKPVQGQADPTPVYKCFPKGHPSNEDKYSEKFKTIEEAAIYLISNPGAGIRVAAIGKGTGEKTAILNSTLLIEI
ncbi:hypothetical protein RvVAR031_27560 [Agrobacterium vitis]|nr:hypothetical protein RvVAR031_27560 [Agrobacterium vitis]